MSGTSQWPIDDVDWPPKPTDATDRVEWIKARVELRKARGDAEIAQRQAEIDADIASEAAYEAAVLEVAKGSIDRAQASADNVQKSATAIVTLYTGLLALAFSVSSHPLPSRGLIPGILLGIAIVLSTAYVAYISKPGSIKEPPPTTSLRELARRRLVTFILWTRQRNLERSYLLRSSVIALGVSLAFLPAPFVTIGKTTTKVATPPPAQLTPWPSLPTESGTAGQAALLRYRAQLAEVTALRKQEADRAASAATIVQDSSEQWWWLAFAVALLAIAFGPWVVARVEPKETDTGTDGTLPEPTLEAQ